jgi:hypothetical protein
VFTALLAPSPPSLFLLFSFFPFFFLCLSPSLVRGVSMVVLWLVCIVSVVSIELLVSLVLLVGAVSMLACICVRALLVSLVLRPCSCARYPPIPGVMVPSVCR